MLEGIMGDNILKAPTHNEQRLVWMEFVRVAAPLILLLALIFIGIHFFYYTYQRNVMDVRERSYIKIGYEAIRNDVRVATSDLLHLARSKHMQDLLENTTDQTRSRLIAEFTSILSTKKRYDQIRYMDETGMEVIRVNFNSGMPLAVPVKKLQNKALRYYFRDTIKLKEGTVFVSPMDLNIENGRIERPLKPVLRFGSPVFDQNGRKHGVLVINYFAQYIIDNIQRYLDSPDSDAMLLNAQGYWLMAPDEKDEWGFMFGNQRRFSSRNPQVWQEMMRQKNGQIKTKDGLYTFITIYPLQQEQASSSGSGKAYAHSVRTLDDKEYAWLLVTHVSRTRLNAGRMDHVKQAALQFGLVMLIVLPLAWLFGHERMQRKSAARDLRKNERYMHVVTSQLAEGLLVTDRLGSLTALNKEAERLLGWRLDELRGAGLQKVLPDFRAGAQWREGDDCAVCKAINEDAAQRKENVLFTTKQGDSLPVSYSAAPLRYDGQVRGAIIIFRDISEQLQMQDELKRMATHDPLTGIKNRGEIERLLAAEYERAQRYGRPLVVLMIDIDHFKTINDTYGHQQGDIVLKTLCRQMQMLLRTSDILGRYGGEEFLVILPETDVSDARVVAQRLCDRLATLSIPVEGRLDIRFTVSIGMAAYPESADSTEQLVRVADDMLYRAKEYGRNRVVDDTAKAGTP